MATRKVIRKRKGGMVAPLSNPHGRGRVVSAPKKRKIGRKILALLLLALAVRWAWVSLDLGKHLTLPYGRAVPVDSVHKVAADSSRMHLDPDAASEAVDIDSTAATVSENPVQEKKTPGAISQAQDWAKKQINKVFIVREIKLQGTLSIPKDTLLAMLGDVQEKPMLELDLFGLAKAIRSHPRVKRVELLRRLPGTLEVRVTERRELAVIATSGGLQGVDEMGVVVSPPALGWPMDVPVITGFRQALEVGDTLQSQNLMMALAWIRKAEREPRVQYWLSEVHVNREGVEWISGANGWRVRPGVHAIGAQVAALNVYLGQQSQENRVRRTLDLRFPGFLIVRQGS
ncbi:MAG: FtsQ-type POTRA domain-containing protein [bacterium]